MRAYQTNEIKWITKKCHTKYSEETKNLSI